MTTNTRHIYAVIFSQRSTDSPNHLPYQNPICSASNISLGQTNDSLNFKDAEWRLIVATLTGRNTTEHLTFLMKVHCPVLRSWKPMGEQQASVCGWATSVGDAALSMKEDAERGGRDNGSEESEGEWEWWGKDGQEYSGVFKREELGRFLQYDVVKVEVLT